MGAGTSDGRERKVGMVAASDGPPTLGDDVAELWRVYRREAGGVTDEKAEGERLKAKG